MKFYVRRSFGISFLFMFSVIALSMFQLQCRHDGIDVSSLNKVCFQRDVLPIFQNSCGTSNCHSATRGKAGLVLTDYTSIMKAITPSDPYKSKAYQAITGKGFTQLMPPSGALSENERILIRVWIQQGAANTTCSTSVVNNASGNGLTLN